ncbi:hypothetical protein pEaSNUABM37_00328 [Erwinia phage pEa_SNUABM_37]|nr:hypothetical protein pEaSNUABM37_00328 [Erwinia phage pEa_SNUABM_37]QXO10796.1 hypothetical protein pEaSNUABM48_00328 [Erwinia phage pEa_SNUABM_48]
MTTLAETIRETVNLTDDLITLVQRADVLESLTGEHTEFAGLYETIRKKIVFIAGSMESIEEHGISQEIMSSIQTMLPGIAPDIPLNGYTRALSDHNVSYAMESLAAGKNVLLAGGVGGFIAIILKAIQWCITTLKAYLKSRREINRVGLGVTTAANRVSLNIDTPADVLDKLVKSKEFINAANGYNWLISIRDDPGAPFAFDGNTMTEWWPELSKEMEYEFKAINARYQALLEGETFKANVSKVKDSAAFYRFFKALPQGVGRDGKPFTVEAAVADFNRDPTIALTNLNSRLGQMFLLPKIDNKEELALNLLRIGRSIETYTMIDRVVYDSLNNIEINRSFDRLHADFTQFYKRVQTQRFMAPQEIVDDFVALVNTYAEKMNCYSRLITVVAYLDAMSYTSGEALGNFVAKWVALMEDRA